MLLQTCTSAVANEYTGPYVTTILFMHSELAYHGDTGHVGCFLSKAYLLEGICHLMFVGERIGSVDHSWTASLLQLGPLCTLR